ncbi:hypothetical protein M8J75_011853 [Diaphorina citri]|nr:hypothetical protein M8J75_011853 [Diaphorina citri]
MSESKNQSDWEGEESSKTGQVNQEGLLIDDDRKQETVENIRKNGHGPKENEDLSNNDPINVQAKAKVNQDVELMDETEQKGTEQEGRQSEIDSKENEDLTNDIPKDERAKAKDIPIHIRDEIEIPRASQHSNKALGDAETNKHVTYSDLVEVIHSPHHQKQVAFSDQVEAIDRMGEPAISDPNFKRKVTFSNEIIVIAYSHDEKPEEEDVEAKTDKAKLKYGKVFGPGTDKLDEITVNYASQMVNRNIFKTVSFSNEVTVIHDGNLVFSTDDGQYGLSTDDGVARKNTHSASRVDKLLTKLKRVVQKLEDKSGAHATRDVLGDAEQDRPCTQVQVVKVENVTDQKQVESIQRNRELREPHLRKVTFSKEIIVIAYPYKSDDGISRSGETMDPTLRDLQEKMRDLQDKTKYEEVEESSVNYAERVVSSRNIYKTVSFSNEVTVIHDANLVFRSDSVESVKEGFEKDCKEVGCEEQGRI